MPVVLSTLFQQHCLALGIKVHEVDAYWKELEQYYSQSHRAYHNLTHLKDLFAELAKVNEFIHDLPAVRMSIWYHDIIYKPLKKNNEEQSADLAAQRLQAAGLSLPFIQKVHTLIVSTKSHQTESWPTAAEKGDNNYLLDLDLSVLGRPWEQYQIYTQQIRREYQIVPGFMYRRGRKKVLQHFLEQEHIYKTEGYRDKYEQIARENMTRELINL